MPYKELMGFVQRANEGGRKSFRYEELKEGLFLQSQGGLLVPYLEALQKDLESRE